MAGLEELLCVQPKKNNWTLIGNEYVDYEGPAWYDKQTGERVHEPKPYEMYDLVYVDDGNPDCNPPNVDVIELEVLPDAEMVLVLYRIY
jgi:hypothetical protein